MFHISQTQQFKEDTCGLVSSHHLINTCINYWWKIPGIREDLVQIRQHWLCSYPSLESCPSSKLIFIFQVSKEFSRAEGKGRIVPRNLLTPFWMSSKWFWRQTNLFSLGSYGNIHLYSSLESIAYFSCL